VGDEASGLGSGDEDASQPDGGDSSHTGSEGSANAAAGGAASFDGGEPDAGELLGEVRALRHEARLARHGYWFPLVLFGLLTFASIPFYVQRVMRSGVHGARTPGPQVLRSGYLGGFGSPLTGAGLAYYWLAALLVGVGATALWYRWRGGQVGLRTPARGYLITGLALLILALLVPVIVQHSSRVYYLMPGDLLIRGTFPFVIIGIGLCVLAWAERSIGLSIIALLYLGLSLVASLYDIENIFYRVGWNLSPSVSGLPNVVLPALMLLLCGSGAWLVQRRHAGRPGAMAEAS
jgi:hypothetical protein